MMAWADFVHWKGLAKWKRRESLCMADVDHDTPLFMAAFAQVRRLGEVHTHLTATELTPGFDDRPTASQGN